MRASLPPTTYDRHYYTPQWGNMDVTGMYWDNLMSSRYAVDLQRIYGVPGSEYVGYGTNDLTIGNPIQPHLQASPRGPLVQGYEVPIEVLSTASSTELKEVHENGRNLNTSKLSGGGDPVAVEKGLTAILQNSSQKIQIFYILTEDNTYNCVCFYTYIELFI